MTNAICNRYIIYENEGNYNVIRFDNYFELYQVNFYSDIDNPITYFKNNLDSLLKMELKIPDYYIGGTSNNIRLIEGLKDYYLATYSFQFREYNSTSKYFYLLALVENLIINAEERKNYK